MTDLPRLGSHLRSGGSALGVLVADLATPTLMPLLRQAGFDVVLLDAEHGAFDPRTLHDMIVLGNAWGIASVVRIPDLTSDAVAKALDAGAAGVLLPSVEDPRTAAELVALASYPPEGRRGFAGRRAHSGWAQVDVEPYLREANERIAVMVQIESGRGLERVDEIAAVPGLDALYIGPFDLSIDLGIPGQTAHPRLIEAREAVVAAAERHGLAAGSHAATVDVARRLRDAGMRFVTYGSDVSLLVDTATRDVRAIRAEEA